MRSYSLQLPDIILGNETQKSQFHFEGVQFSTRCLSGRIVEAS